MKNYVKPKMRLNNEVLVVKNGKEDYEQFLLDLGIITPGNYDIVDRATKKMAVDKHVIGSVPLGMAALCKSVTVVNFFYPKEKQGKELTLKEMYEYYEGTYRYQVNEQEVSLSEY